MQDNFNIRLPLCKCLLYIKDIQNFTEVLLVLNQGCIEPMIYRTKGGGREFSYILLWRISTVKKLNINNQGWKQWRTVVIVFTLNLVPERFKYVTAKCICKLYPPLLTSTLIVVHEFSKSLFINFIRFLLKLELSYLWQFAHKHRKKTIPHGLKVVQWSQIIFSNHISLQTNDISNYWTQHNSSLKYCLINQAREFEIWFLRSPTSLSLSNIILLCPSFFLFPSRLFFVQDITKNT